MTMKGRDILRQLHRMKIKCNVIVAIILLQVFNTALAGEALIIPASKTYTISGRTNKKDRYYLSEKGKFQNQFFEVDILKTVYDARTGVAARIVKISDGKFAGEIYIVATYDLIYLDE